MRALHFMFLLKPSAESSRHWIPFPFFMLYWMDWEIYFFLNKTQQRISLLSFGNLNQWNPFSCERKDGSSLLLTLGDTSTNNKERAPPPLLLINSMLLFYKDCNLVNNYFCNTTCNHWDDEHLTHPNQLETEYSYQTT